jgi:hypothetical protein
MHAVFAAGVAANCAGPSVNSGNGREGKRTKPSGAAKVNPMSPRRLTKEESRERFAQGRNLWNEFDPIGVADAVNDEYDNYVGPCLRIVEAGKSGSDLSEYVSGIVFEYIGLNRNQLLEQATKKFCERFARWYEERWPNTIT